MNKTTNVIFFMALVASTAFGAGAPDPVEPDYTKGETMSDPGLNYAALGPTGAHGWIWAQRGGDPTAETRMILIKSVDKVTPADGVLQEGDVILGIGTTRFTSDARKALSAAITEAEKDVNKGKLVLNIWRPDEGSEGKTGPSAEASASAKASPFAKASSSAKATADKTADKTAGQAGQGKEMQVTLTLPVMGAYSATSPRDCPKTEAIIKAACDAIVKRGIDKAGNQVACCLDALGLLATGDETYWPLVRKYIEVLDAQARKEGFESLWTWPVAYANLLLCEYYLLTKDETVKPIITRYATRIAMGRSGVGTWGHGFADPAQNDGKPFGMPSGYGSMNQIGLTCALSLALAQKCGVNDPYIETALKKSSDFMTFYVDKGTIPYGDHDPQTTMHENNGVNSQAAVLFDILGNKEAATYFTRMTLASYNERERGHTGHFFNWNWGALGAARAGEEAATSFMRNTRWFAELERRPDGGFIYQPQLANVDHGKYLNWSTAGSRLLQYCLPRKQLYITGKGSGVVEPMIRPELKKVVQAQEIAPGETKTVGDLLNLLGHWSPRIRHLAAMELNKRDDDVVDKLIAMLESKSRYARYGACTGLRFAGRGSEKALGALVDKGLRSDESTMRYHAINALMVNPWWKNPDRNQGVAWEKTMGPVSNLAVPALADAVLKEYPQEARPWTRTYAGYALFGNYSLRDRGPAGQGLLVQNKDAWKALDINDRVKVVEALLQSEFGNVRTSVGFCYPHFSEQEIALLMPAILRAVEFQAPSGTMFGGGVRLEGLKILTNYNIKEGMEAGVKWTIRMPGWGNWYRKTRGLPVLAEYGTALKEYLPEIEAVMEPMIESIEKKNPDDRNLKGLEDSLNKIKTSPSPELVTIEEFQKAVLEQPDTN